MNFTGPLEDRIAIRELCDQYCDGIMSNDMTVWGNTWAVDGEWVRMDMTTKGRAAIVADAAEYRNTCPAVAFFCNLGSTHVEGNHAKGRCYQVEVFFFVAGAEWYLSSYDDEYVKIDGRWYFRKRSFALMKNGTL